MSFKSVIRNTVAPSSSIVTLQTSRATSLTSTESVLFTYTASKSGYLVGNYTNVSLSAVAITSIIKKNGVVEYEHAYNLNIYPFFIINVVVGDVITCIARAPITLQTEALFSYYFVEDFEV